MWVRGRPRAVVAARTGPGCSCRRGFGYERGVNRYLAEGIGTFALVFAGTGAIDRRGCDQR